MTSPSPSISHLGTPNISCFPPRNLRLDVHKFKGIYGFNIAIFLNRIDTAQGKSTQKARHSLT